MRRCGSSSWPALLGGLSPLPVDELKIDRSFVAELTSAGRPAVIVSSTLQLAARLGLHAVAEGIEDHETWSALTALGCPAIQGYAVARPMPGAELREWAARRPANRIPMTARPRRQHRGRVTCGGPWPPPPTSAPSPSASPGTRGRSPSRAR